MIEYILLIISIVFIASYIFRIKLLKKNSITNAVNFDISNGDETYNSSTSASTEQMKTLTDKQKKEIEIELNKQSYLIRIEEPVFIQKEEQKNYKDNFHQFYEEIQDISNEPIVFENIFRDQMRDNYGKTSISARKTSFHHNYNPIK